VSAVNGQGRLEVASGQGDSGREGDGAAVYHRRPAPGCRALDIVLDPAQPLSVSDWDWR